MKPIVIAGLGGVGRCVLELIRQINAVQPAWNFAGFVDDSAPPVARGDYLGPIACMAERTEHHVVVAIGDPKARAKVTARLVALGVRNFPALVHPTCVHPAGWMPGEGTIIYPGAVIDPDVRVGRFVLINKLCTIGHDAELNDFVTLSPAVNIGGRVSVGEGVFFGIRSATVQNLAIGRHAVVGAGATVLSPVAEGLTVVGTPARSKQAQR